MSSVTDRLRTSVPARTSPGLTGVLGVASGRGGGTARQRGRRATTEDRRRRGRRLPGSAGSQETEIPVLLTVEHLVIVEDPRAGNAAAGKALAPRRPTARARDALPRASRDLLAMAQATAALAEPLALEQRIGRQKIDEVRAHSASDRHVTRGIHRRSRTRRRGQSASSRSAAWASIAACSIDVSMLTGPPARPHEKPRTYRLGDDRRRDEIHESVVPDAPRAAVRVGVARGKAAERLHVRIGARLVPHRPGPPESRRRAVDERGIPAGQIVEAEADARQGTGPEVLDHDIGIVDQGERELPVCLVLEIEADRPLALVQGQVGRAEPGRPWA